MELRVYLGSRHWVCTPKANQLLCEMFVFQLIVAVYPPYELCSFFWALQALFGSSSTITRNCYDMSTRVSMVFSLLRKLKSENADF